MCRSCIWGSKFHLVKRRTFYHIYLNFPYKGLGCPSLKQQTNDYLSETRDGWEEVGLDDLNVHSFSTFSTTKNILEKSLSYRKGIPFPLQYLYPSFKDVLYYSEKQKINGSKRKKSLKWSSAEVKIQIVIFSPDLFNLSPVVHLPLDGDTSLGHIGITSF